jgi:UDP-2,4-diacetamido-2,4,6-trideoxy-beta-L-altropyranose hydrolase
MNVAFRVDASAQIGTGHFMRCLSLADGLHANGNGAAIRFVSRALPAHLQAMLDERAYPLAPLGAAADGGAHGDLRYSSWLGTSQTADAEETLRGLAGGTWDWLVVDHYALDVRWERALRAAATRILAIDDLADRRHDCDVLLDQNLLDDADARYDDKVPSHCEQLLGPRFALLRESLRRARAAVSPRTGAAVRALIMFGGIDIDNWTALAIDAVAAASPGVAHVDVVIGAQHLHRADIESACRRHGFACHVQPPDLTALIAAADLAIGAGGVTLWERCCMGVPSLAVAVAENQREMVRESACRALVATLPEGDITVPSLAAQFSALAQDGQRRAALSRNGMAAVDGDGTARVVRAMEARDICVREATAGDSASLFEWRNHDSVRMFARHTDPIAPADHQAWLRGVLANPDRVLLICERHGHPVGVVRFDISGERVEISVYRVPGSPGRGLGTPMLLAAEQWLSARKPALVALFAEVHDGNESSQRMVQTAGYRRQAGDIYEKRLRP